MININPLDDGITHVNIYTKGKTNLGKMLSNFHQCDIIIDGIKYRTVEHYWQWAKAIYVNDLATATSILKMRSAASVKKAGSDLNTKHGILSIYVKSEVFRELIRKAITLKVHSNASLKKLLTYNIRPFTHYYVYNNTAIEQDTHYGWMLNHIERLQLSLQREYLDQLLHEQGHKVFRMQDKPKNCVNIARPSVYGNIYTHLSKADVSVIKVNSLEKAVIGYRNFLAYTIKNDPVKAKEMLKGIKGKKLVCWCNNGTNSAEQGGKYCHGLVLAKAAESIDSIF